MVQASSLGPNKHRIGEEGLCGVSINKSAVDFERVFEVEKRLKK